MPSLATPSLAMPSLATPSPATPSLAQPSRAALSPARPPLAEPSPALPPYTAGQPAARVDAHLREALAACDRARQCAVLWFAEVQRRALYRELGHASLQIYATQALGFSDNRFRQFKRLADDLDRLPALRTAMAAGELGWTKAQQVARVASPATQSAWVARAKTTGRRELEQEVRAACSRQRPPRRSEDQLELAVAAPAAVSSTAIGMDAPATGGTSDRVRGAPDGAAIGTAGPATGGTSDRAPRSPAGDRARIDGCAPPLAPSQPAARAPAHADNVRHTISLQLDAWQLARFEALLGQVRRRRLVPATADRTDVVLAALALLAGSDGRAMREGAIDGESKAGEASAARATAPRLAATDDPHAHDVAGGTARRASRRAASGAPPAQVVVQRCPDCGATAVATSRGEIALSAARGEALACDARVRRAGQPNRATVPPRLRAAVLARDRHRCASPGCGATQFLEVHHVVPRNAGGANEAANLVTLCSRCHGFVHEHRLRAPAHAQPHAQADTPAQAQLPAQSDAQADAPAQAQLSAQPHAQAPAPVEPAASRGAAATDAVSATTDRVPMGA